MPGRTKRPKRGCGCARQREAGWGQGGARFRLFAPASATGGWEVWGGPDPAMRPARAHWPAGPPLKQERGVWAARGAMPVSASAWTAPPPVRVRSRHTARRTNPPARALGVDTSYRPVDHKLLGTVGSHQKASSAHLAQSPSLTGPEDPADNQQCTYKYPCSPTDEAPLGASLLLLRVRKPPSASVDPNQQRTLHAHSPSRPPCIVGRVLASMDHLRFDPFLAPAGQHRPPF